MQNQNNMDSPIINNNNLGENVKIIKEIKNIPEKAAEKPSKEKEKKKNYPISKKAEIKTSGGVTGRLLTAVLFVSLGLIFIARNYNIINFDILESIALFWPLVFIFIGIFLSLKESWWPVTLSLFALILISAMTITVAAREKKNYKDDNYAAVAEVEKAWEMMVDGVIAEEAGKK